MVVAVLVRLPFVFTGLSTDEGGYAYVARRWASGERLYDTVWLDRPQGLLLTYRLLLSIGGEGWTIRVGMVLAGAVLTVAVAAIAGLLVGRRAAIGAAWIYAIAGLAPHLEGMTLNGELLAGVPSTVSIALLVLWWRRERSLWWLAGAGLLAGAALTMKQSGIDGIVVGAALLVALRRCRHLALFGAAAAVPVAASALHGLVTGWGAYWSALAGYQFAALGGEGSNSSTRLADLGQHAGDIALDTTLILLVSLLGWRWLDRGGRWVLGAWLFAGFVGINLGGSYWPHYFVQPYPALVVLAAAAVAGLSRIPKTNATPKADATPQTSATPKADATPKTSATLKADKTCANKDADGANKDADGAEAGAGGPGWMRRRLGPALGVILVLPTLVWLVALVPMSAQRRADTIPYDALARRDDRIAEVIEASTAPDDRIYVLESEAYLYFAADRVSPYPYLWGKPIDKIPSALPELRAMLASPARPKLVVLDTPPAAVDPSGGIAADLAAYYEPFTTVEGVPILRAAP
ncbi:hypothetical protein [Actinoplanes sp. RD1]|uniref:hypothetical protein n=1 Tax=Actinoplanes sp. RD1 TaxID=3064538 RepID=UPI00274188DB|nr:hypothetical protein [Actinoplanes sp. RD1]